MQKKKTTKIKAQTMFVQLDILVSPLTSWNPLDILVVLKTFWGSLSFWGPFGLWQLAFWVN